MADGEISPRGTDFVARETPWHLSGRNEFLEAPHTPKPVRAAPEHDGAVIRAYLPSRRHAQRHRATEELNFYSRRELSAKALLGLSDYISWIKIPWLVCAGELALGRPYLLMLDLSSLCPSWIPTD